MKQFFTSYDKWEDYKNGMWNTFDKSEEENLIEKAIKCLCNPEIAMRRVIKEWPVASKVNLTNISSNRKSWLGQAACCLQYGVPEILTRKAWMRLNDNQRINANNIAKKIIEQWEREYLS